MRVPTKVKTGPSSLLVKLHSDISSEWLTELFEEPTTLISVKPVGTGLVASSYRVRFEGPDGPGSVIAKLSAEDAGSRHYGVSVGAYEKEICFYSNLGMEASATGVIPQCWLAILDTDGWFSLILEDISDGEQGDQVAGLTVEQVEMGIDSLAGLHAPFVNRKDVESASWIATPEAYASKLGDIYRACIDPFLARHEGRFTPEHEAMIRWLGEVMEPYIIEPTGTLDGIRHVDYRADNILFTPIRAVAVDFQGCGYGILGHDLSYFIGGSVEPEVRRKHEKEWFKRYIDKLQAGTKEKIDSDLVWLQYRRQTPTAFLIVLTSAMGCVETPRSRSMFEAMLSRACQQAIDLDSKSVLEAEIAARTKA